METPDLTDVIGTRVRHERRARRWTQEQLCEASGVSRRMLVTVEQGTANPSIGTLLKLSDALGVALAALVEQPRTVSVTVTPTGTGPVLWSSAEGGRAVLVASTTPPDVVELWDWTLGPADSYASEAHVAGTRELLHVLEGDVVVEVDGQQHALGVGDAVSFSGDAPHAYVNPGTAAARFSLSVFEPDVGRPRA